MSVCVNNRRGTRYGLPTPSVRSGWVLIISVLFLPFWVWLNEEWQSFVLFWFYLEFVAESGDCPMALFGGGSPRSFGRPSAFPRVIAVIIDFDVNNLILLSFVSCCYTHWNIAGLVGIAVCHVH